jgi:hypothetical protein
MATDGLAVAALRRAFVHETRHVLPLVEPELPIESR